MKTIYLLIFGLIFSFCGRNHETVDLVSNDSTFSAMTVYKDTTGPFTRSTVLISLDCSRILIDSLRKYFPFQNILRLDTICQYLLSSRLDSLPILSFRGKYLKLRSKVDSVPLSHSQYLVGNYFRKFDSLEYLVFVDYTEAWGRDIVLLSIDENNLIVDYQSIFTVAGDGGDFIDSQLQQISDSVFRLTEKVGYETITEPVDSMIYTLTTKEIELRKSGYFKTSILKVDSNIIETFTINN